MTPRSSSGNERRVLRLALLRVGPAWVAFVGTVLIAGAHVLLRSTWWRYEWGWAWYQYHFVTIILCPFLAGVACYWGSRWAAARTLIGTAPRGFAAVWGLTSTVLLPALTAYLLGLGAISAVVASTTGTSPAGNIVLTLGPPLLLMFAVCAVGTVVGIRSGNWALAPVLAVAVFALLLLGYTVGPARFVKVGGATATLLGLETRPAIQAGQMLLFGGVGLLSLVLIRTRQIGRSFRPETVAAAPLCVALIGFGVLASIGGQEFQATKVDLICQGESPRICVAPGYQRVVDDLRTALAPHYRALAAADIPAPRDLVQLPVASLPGGVLIDPVSILRSPEYSDGYILSGYIPAKCSRISSDYRAGQGFAILADYMQKTYAESKDVALNPGQKATLQAAFDDLTSCRA